MTTKATKENTRIGLIGIGNMGGPMATNLLEAGWKVTVYDTDAAKVKSFAAEKGAGTAGSLAELAKNCPVVITMLPDGHIVRRVALGKGAEDDSRVKPVVPGNQ